MLQWLRRRQEARRLAQADAEALKIRDHGAEAYGEARERERDVILIRLAPAADIPRRGRHRPACPPPTWRSGSITGRARRHKRPRIRIRE
jgi:hypothetical protein